MEKKELIQYLDKLKEPKILIIGDFALDEMVYGNTERISREAPVLILEHYETKKILGAASNAAHNVSRLNLGKASAIGVYGDDYYGSELLKILEEKGINTSLMVMDKTRKTTTKTRISGSCNQSITQQIVRIDRQTKTPLNKETEEKIIENIKKAIPNLLNSIMSVIPRDVQLTSIENTTSKHIVISAQAEKYEQLGYFTAILKTEGILLNVESSSGLKQSSVVKITIEGDLTRKNY